MNTLSEKQEALLDGIRRITTCFIDCGSISVPRSVEDFQKLPNNEIINQAVNSITIQSELYVLFSDYVNTVNDLLNLNEYGEQESEDK